MALTQVKTTGLADDAVTGAKIADDTVAEANMANDAISLTELKAGTDGQIITYDASGNPTAVGPGTDGQVLTSTGAGSPPAFEALPASNNYTHPNHSGEVTSTADGAQVIASNIVDEDNLKISNAGSNGQYLQKQSGNTGGLTWADVSAGINEYDRWRVTSGFSGAASPITSNWERNDNSAFDKIGTGMSESSGVFTFPSTGKWHMTFNMNYWYAGSGGVAYTRWTSVEIYTCENFGSGDTWVLQARSQDGLYTPDANGAYSEASCNGFLDVTNVGTHKARFAVNVGSSISSNQVGSTDKDDTFVTFWRLGDT